MAQNWIEMGDVKMNVEVAEYIVKNDFFIVLRPNEGEEPETQVSKKKRKMDGEYPWLAYWPKKCLVCGRWDRCKCHRVPVPYRALHLLAWDTIRGATDPRKPGEVIHHKNGDKKDARIKNLGKGTRRAHGLAHKARRQKFSPKKKLRLGLDLFRPHQPARVLTKTEMIGQSVEDSPSPSPMPSKAQHVREVEERLGALHEKLSAEMRPLDSGAPIPKNAPSSAWRPPKSRMLGLKMPRLEPSPDEAAFVLELVKHRHDIDTIAAETAEHPDLLRAFFERPAVSEARRRWREWKRLSLAPE